MDYEATICKWAEQEFGLENVAKVDFETATRQGGYCETCAYTYEVMEFFITFADGSFTEEEKEYFDPQDMIRECLKIVDASKN